MKVHPHYSKKIAHSIVALGVLAENTEDAAEAELLRDAAFYLMELAVKHAYPEAQSLIEMRPAGQEIGAQEAKDSGRRRAQ